MKADKKIIRAKVQLQNEKPFFAYLLMNLNFKELKDIKTIGVSNKGVCAYNPKFIEELNDRVLKGILAHEVLHLVFEHLSRLGDKDLKIWNIATDLCINDLLKENGFELDSRGLVTNWSHDFTFNFNGEELFTIKDIDKKNADQVYEEIIKNLKKNKQKIIDEYDKKRFDKHIYEKGKGETEAELKGYKDKWKKAVAEASAYAKQKGDLSNGLKLLVDDLLNEKVNWKHLLYKYMTRVIPFDYSYARPSKRSFSTGVYMPIMRKESIEIVVSLDTSGSIGKEELQEFMSEINGIAKSFNNLTMKLIVCDSEVKDVYTIGNGDNQKINDLVIRGGGGTSHIPIYDYVQENLPNTKLLVNFTDGYTDFPQETSINSLWVLCKHSCSEDKIPFGEVIKLN